MVGVKTIWTAAMDQFLIDNRATMTTRQLGAALGLTLMVVRNRCYALGLFAMEMEYWTKRQIQFLTTNYKKMGDTEIARIFNEKYPKKKRWIKQHIEKKRFHLGLKRTPEELVKIHERNYKSGRLTENHYKRWLGIENKIGTIRTWRSEHDRYPYLVIKVKDEEADRPGGYIKLAHYNWIKANGKIPKGFVITHKDKNPLNCELENLECISLKELVKRNIDHESDNWIAGITARSNKELKEELLKHPMILDLRRAQIKLNKEIKHAVRKTA